ncbi:hypothetical protein BH18ACT11_BH18ACT11_20730 [soil metagenome]
MRSEEVRPGVPVRVLDAAKRGGRGRIGTIERTYGHPSYLAMEVRFEDGSVELYWHHELQQGEEYADGAKGKQESRRPSPSRDRNRDRQAPAG